MAFRLALAAILLLAAAPGFPADGGAWVAEWNRILQEASDAWASGSDPETAGRLYRTALEQVESHAAGSLRHARTLDELAYFHFIEGRPDRAEPLYLRSIPMFAKLLGPDQPRLATSLHNLGALYLQTGREAEAEAPVREALRIWSATLGPDHPDTARANRSLAVLMRRKGLDQEADRLEALAARHLRDPAAPPGR